MIPIVLLWLLLPAIPAGLQATPASEQVQLVRVAAAADLKFALDEAIGRLGRQHPALRMQATYGSSGSMHAQLQQRAPHDVYLSADMAYPRDLVSKGIGAADDLFVYATGRLVVWVPHDSSLAVERLGLGALESAGRIAIANPRHAPYGRAAEAAMRREGIWDRVSGRLVLGENVAQAAQFAQSGAADAAIIAKSIALSPAMRRAGRYWDVPQEMHPRLEQGGLILPWARSREAAMRVREYLVGPEGRELLASYGFGLPPR